MKLQIKFASYLLTATIVAVSLIILIFYHQAKSAEELNAYDTCYKILASIEASRGYVREELRPKFVELMGEKTFVPEAMSASFVAREQFERFLKEYPDYYVKFASTNPRNPLNQADEIERRLINNFTKDPDLKEWQGNITRNGAQYFTVAKPFRFKKNCIRCHGIPEDAPQSLIARYGDKNGFGVKTGDVTMYSIGVPAHISFTSIWNKALLHIIPVILLSCFMLVFSSILFRKLTHKLKKSETELLKMSHDLGERVKELGCLYGISKLVEDDNNTAEEILHGTADLIPPSWQYPEITCARLILKENVYLTDNFNETEWKQVQDIKLSGEKAGTVEVFYLEKRPDIDEGPFLKEERELINVIAERLGRIVERLEAEKKREVLIGELQNALDEVKTLQGILPICMHCKEIRDDKGSWNQLEKYISQHSEAKFSHGICEKCLRKHHPNIADKEL